MPLGEGAGGADEALGREGRSVVGGEDGDIGEASSSGGGEGGAGKDFAGPPSRRVGVDVGDAGLETVQ